MKSNNDKKENHTSIFDYIKERENEKLDIIVMAINFSFGKWSSSRWKIGGRERKRIEEVQTPIYLNPSLST